MRFLGDSVHNPWQSPDGSQCASPMEVKDVVGVLYWNIHRGWTLDRGLPKCLYRAGGVRYPAPLQGAIPLIRGCWISGSPQARQALRTEGTSGEPSTVPLLRGGKRHAASYIGAKLNQSSWQHPQQQGQQHILNVQYLYVV